VSIVARRKTSRPRGGVSLTAETQLGSHSLIFNDEDVVLLLRAAVEREGNQVAFARHHGLERTTLNQILNRRKRVTRAVLKAIGLRKVYAPE
jgi:DNA-binding phage protein